MPHIPRETKMDVAKCHACHAKLGGVTGDQARPSAPKRHQSQPSPISTTPATQNEVSRLPCKVVRRHQRPSAPQGAQARPSAPPEPAQCHKCHACHAKRRWISPSARPATQNEARCRQVPRLPRKVARRHRRLIPAQARHQWWLTKMCVCVRDGV